jgi:hypothetical protein
MTHRIAVVACLLLAGLSGHAQTPAPSDPREKPVAPPRIEIDQDVIDLGSVIRGEEAVASFAIRNEGGETLRILKAKPG